MEFCLWCTGTMVMRFMSSSKHCFDKVEWEATHSEGVGYSRGHSWQSLWCHNHVGSIGLITLTFFQWLGPSAPFSTLPERWEHRTEQQVQLRSSCVLPTPESDVLGCQQTAQNGQVCLCILFVFLYSAFFSFCSLCHCEDVLCEQKWWNIIFPLWHS